MDVESLLKKSKETRDKIRTRIKNNNYAKDNKPTTIDSINLENKQKPDQSLASSHKGDTESEEDTKREKHVIVEERQIDLLVYADTQNDEKPQQFSQPKNSSKSYEVSDDFTANNMNRSSDPYLVYSNTTEMLKKQPKTAKNGKNSKDYGLKPKKHVSISMNETPCRTFREGNHQRAEIEVSPNLNSQSRLSPNLGRLNTGVNRSSTSSNA